MSSEQENLCMQDFRQKRDQANSKYNMKKLHESTLYNPLEKIASGNWKLLTVNLLLTQ